MSELNFRRWFGFSSRRHWINCIRLIGDFAETGVFNAAHRVFEIFDCLAHGISKLWELARTEDKKDDGHDYNVFTGDTKHESGLPKALDTVNFNGHSA